MTTNYSLGLVADNRALAKLSGIAAGWVQDLENEDLCAYRVGCEVCNFAAQEAITTKQLGQMSLRDPEGWFKELVWRKFKESEQGEKCPHIVKYEFWRQKQNEFHSGVLMLGLLEFLDQEGKSIK